VQPRDLLRRIADVVIAEEPREQAEKTIQTALALCNGNRGAIFAREQEAMLLFASCGADQDVLERLQAVWQSERLQLEAGQAVVVALHSHKAGSGRSAAIAPVFDDRALVGLLYLESVEERFTSGTDLGDLRQLARIAAVALKRPSPRLSAGPLATYLERTPVDEIEREQLFVLLERNEWNIARTARVLGVARRTIYLRLAKHGITRRRIPKVLRRHVPA
jgi:transcriptional regulator with GAF, ATPase, and Fis domain